MNVAIAIIAAASVFDYAGQYRNLVEKGDKSAAFELAYEGKTDAADAVAVAKALVDDEKAKPAVRCRAWNWLRDKDPAWAEAAMGRLLAAKDRSLGNGVVDNLRWELGQHLVGNVYGRRGPSYDMDWELVAKDWELYSRLATERKQKLWFECVQNAVVAYTGLGRFNKAEETVRTGLADTNRPPADVYELKMMGETLACCGLKSAGEVRARLAAREPQLAEGLPAKDRQARLERALALGIVSCDKVLAQGAADYYGSLMAPAMPMRTYVVRGAAEKADEQAMDRPYGGAGSAFLVTDVASGDRGNAAENAEGETAVTLRIVATERTLDFVYDIRDARARQYESGELDAGSFENYLSAGERKPYCCFMAKPKEGDRPTVFNTAYEEYGVRRFTNGGRFTVANATTYADDRIVCRLSLPWEGFSRLPENGESWEFESIYWGAKPLTWNGCSQIHGRSSWGRLVFRLDASLRAKIIRRLLYLAAADYRREQNPRGSVASVMRAGALNFWTDEELGDPAFYEACVKPLEVRLNPVVARINAQMTDEEARDIYEKSYLEIRDVGHAVERLRARYLRERMTDNG